MPFFNEGKLQTHINSFACALECVKTSANKRPHPLVQETNSDAASRDLISTWKLAFEVTSSWIDTTDILYVNALGL